MQIVEHGARHLFYAGINVAVPLVTKFYEKIVKKKYSDKLCYEANFFIAKDN